MANVLLLSNSTMPGTAFFTWPRPWVSEFLGSSRPSLLFIPFAAVTFSFDEYAEKVAEVFHAMGYRITSLHQAKDKRHAVENAGGIVVGGGNTFALLSRIYEHELLQPIRERIKTGVPYVGWSAGANLAAPTIMTTNDMPVVEPPSFKSLDLLPFQINPHYHELKFENQGGETRKERLEEFLFMNPSKKVIGLPEGMLLQRNGNTLMLKGSGKAKLYEAGKPVVEIIPGTDLSYLLA